MMVVENNNEDFLKELIRQGDIEKAPAGFADKVMSSLEVEPEKARARWWTQSSTWLWGAIILGVASLVVVTFMIDFSFMNSIFSGIEIDGTRINQFFTYLGNGFSTIFEGFNVSSISIIILIAFLGLFAIDRLLRRRPKMEMNLI